MLALTKMIIFPIDYHTVVDGRYNMISMICYNEGLERVAVLIRYPNSFYVSGIERKEICNALEKISGVEVVENPERRKSTRDPLKMLDAYRVDCDAMYVKRSAIEALQRKDAMIHELNPILTPILKLIDEQNIAYYSWMSIEVEEVNPYMTFTAKEYKGNYRTLKKLEVDRPPPKLSILSFDLECNSVDWDVMCNANTDMGNDIKQACITYVHGDMYREYAIINGPDLSEMWKAYIDEGVRVVTADNEFHLLRIFFAYIKKLDPDIIIGHNITGFDVPYIISRWRILTMMNGMRSQLPNISRYRDFIVTPYNVEWNNSQVSMSGKLLNAPGRIWIDTLILASRGYLGAMENNKLDTLAKVHLGMSKNDVSHKDMFAWFYLWSNQDPKIIDEQYEIGLKKYNKVLPPMPDKINVNHINDLIVLSNVTNQRGDRKELYTKKDAMEMDLQKAYDEERKIAEDLISKWNIPRIEGTMEKLKTLWWIVGRYCVHDTRIPYRIVALNHIITVLMEQSNIFCVPINDILCRGQIHAVTSSQYRYARAQGFLVDLNEKGDPSGIDKVGGGFVAHNQPGMKVPDDDSIVIVVDFASLYPTIVIAYNICYTTWVPYDKRGTEIPEEWCNIFVIDDRVDSKTGEKLPDLIHWFLKKEILEGICPSMLWKQYGDRKAMKKKMAAAKGTPMYYIYNAQQLATKGGMNSAYGAFGTEHSYICNKAAGDTITGIGRKSTKKVNTKLEERGLEVVYNDTDSAMVLIRGIKEKFNCEIARIKEYGDNLARDISKDFPDPMELEAENYFLSFFLRSPKMYTAIKWDWKSTDLSSYGFQYIEANNLLYVKGLASARKDKYRLYKIIYNKILEMVLTKRPVDYVIRALEKYIMTIWNLSQSGDYKKIEEYFHYNMGISYKALHSSTAMMGKWVSLYEKNMKRKPVKGERFRLLVCSDGGKKASKSADKLYTIDWMIRENKKLDIKHYLSCFESPGGIIHILNIAYGDTFKMDCVSDFYTKKLLQDGHLG